MADKKPQPEIWVKVVEAHAAKTWMGLILTVCAGLSLVIIAAGAVANTLLNPDVTDLSANYMTLLGTTMGTVFGSAVGYLSGQNVARKTGDDATANEGDLTLRVNPPDEST